VNRFITILMALAVALNGYCQRAEIAPLLQTAWGQGAPYNLQCPKKGGMYCQTGCVATAMAQIMYYHRCPATGFDWNNMQLTYTGNETDVQQQAVAKLMAECGKAAGMEYGVGSSSAFAMDAAEAFSRDFGYQETSGELYRMDYSDEEWEELIYNELAAGRPVLYSGSPRGYFHQFVCDGYKDGKFHFNMAWHMVADGYCALTQEDFDKFCPSYSQTAILQIQPNATGIKKITPSLLGRVGERLEVYRLANLCLYKIKY